jgi:methyl-accepting chemotaxis protein
MIRRILGLILLLVGLSGLVLSVAGAIVGRRLVDDVVGGIDENLAITAQTLDTVEDTLILTRDTVSEVNAGLETVEISTRNLSRAVSETQPLIEQVAVVTGEDVPQSLEAIQDTIPNLAEVAGAVDETLTTLSRLRLEETIPIVNYTIDLNLGVDYQPEMRFDESIIQIGESIEGVPERLRSLQVYINVANENLTVIGDDLDQIAADLEDLNQQADQLDPLVVEYMNTTTELSDNVRLMRTNLRQQQEQIQLIVTIAMIWLGLTQLAPLYLGWELITERR